MSILNTSDTWSCACYLIRVHGEQAVAVALEYMKQRCEDGDHAGEDAWYAIAAATSDLQRLRFVGEAVH